MTLSTARANYARAPKADPATLDIIWRTNVEILQRIIHEAPDERGAFYAINRLAFFDFTCTAPLLEPAVRWYAGRLATLRCNIPFDESALICDERVTEHQGIRVSTDMLYRLLSIAHLTRRGLQIENARSILEIGGGYGSLARTIMGINPRTRYVLVDLPESLFFAELFLRDSFPAKTIAYADESGWPEGADIVLVPVALRRLLTGQPFDLAINTNSLGEMTREDAKDWLDWLATDIRPERFWSLNRFLNRVDETHAGHREKASGMNFLWGPEWTVLDWEVNPPYERCPYYMSIVTRNLSVLVDLSPHGFDAKKAAPRIRDIGLQDWAALPHWEAFELKFGGKRPMMAKGWPDLTPDLTRSGVLYELWEAKRHGMPVDALLRQHLDMLAGGGDGFEEMGVLR